MGDYVLAFTFFGFSDFWTKLTFSDIIKSLLHQLTTIQVWNKDNKCLLTSCWIHLRIFLGPNSRANFPSKFLRHRMNQHNVKENCFHHSCREASMTSNTLGEIKILLLLLLLNKTDSSIHKSWNSYKYITYNTDQSIIPIKVATGTLCKFVALSKSIENISEWISLVTFNTLYTNVLNTYCELWAGRY